MEEFGRELPGRNSKNDEQQTNLAVNVQTEESSRAESTFREHNTTTSGDVSEQVNAQILTSLIETENYNSKCLREL